jgi:hypothetical protein
LVQHYKVQKRKEGYKVIINRKVGRRGGRRREGEGRRGTAK